MAAFEDQQGYPGILRYRRALRWIDCPTFDMYHRIRVPYQSQDNGLPADEAVLDSLRRFESTLVDTLGSQGVLVAHHTIRGQRLFHVYTDSMNANSTDIVLKWVKSRQIGVESFRDSGWRHLREITS
ncbi:DUF695 domain-containing protein [Devriesea agamarum]|uniref:DUF695 domain-containing protein n=1 Tax=Devriesea agamarum TaxID=472569 RepID=UPI00071D869C|nr:DUF695 domain-containing protein [Devriesea agamarum]